MVLKAVCLIRGTEKCKKHTYMLRQRRRASAGKHPLRDCGDDDTNVWMRPVHYLRLHRRQDDPPPPHPNLGPPTVSVQLAHSVLSRIQACGLAANLVSYGICMDAYAKAGLWEKVSDETTTPPTVHLSRNSESKVALSPQELYLQTPVSRVFFCVSALHAQEGPSNR